MTRDFNLASILVTGGAGYIGSHTVLLLLEQDYKVVVIDNCSNAYIKHDQDDQLDANGNVRPSMPESLRRVEEMAGKQLGAFYNFDLVDHNQHLLDDVFRRHNIKAVIHFASLKSVNESIALPLEYYTNNLVGTINLLNTMKRFGCKKLIFSSSATVYGLPRYLPVDESHQVGQNILNPYGRTKFMIEQILRDLCLAPPTGSDKQQVNNNNNNNGEEAPQGWNIISLRYFNPVGAHPSGYIGEHTQETPNNLMPYISQVSIGKRDRLYVFGNDFDTIDGTGVRDYIHIMDLASGHTHALSYLFQLDNQIGEAKNNYKAFNLGTGRGYSVLELIKTFEEVNKVRIPYEVTKRREGDAGEVYADASLAHQELAWKAKYSLVEMCRDTYKWQSEFPEGFKTSRIHQNN